MDDGTHGCGPLYALYAAARAGDVDAVRTRWEASRSVVTASDPALAARIDGTVSSGEPEAVARLVAGPLFVDEDPPALDGPAAALVGALLFAFGYVVSFVLFFGARSRESVVGRLRWAYRTVGVDVRDTETVEGVERTVFRCPYRNVAAGRYGQRRVCHDVLDRVDDGYVSFLSRHRDIDYDRPRGCAASECCYSEVSAS